MNRTSIGGVALVAVGLLAVIGFQRVQLSRAMREQGELHRQLQAAGGMARAESEENLTPALNPEEPAQPAQSGSSELLRLRNEVTQLRAELGRMRQLEAENTALKSRTGAIQKANAWDAAAGRPSPEQITPLPRRNAWVGLALQAGPDGTVQVGGVLPNSPALDAQLQPGDVITRMDGVAVTNLLQVRNGIATRQPGQLTVLEVVRQGIAHQVYLTPREPPRELLEQENRTPDR